MSGPATLLALLLLAGPAEVPADVQVAAQALRPGERARLEAALGPLAGLPTYRVELELDPARRQVTGTVSITFTPRQPLSLATLRLTPAAAHPGAVTLSGLEVDGERRGFAQPDPSLRTVALAPPAAAGQPVRLSFRLSARVPALPEAPPLGLPTGGKGGDHGAFAASADFLSLVGLVPMLAPVKEDGELMEGPSGVGDLGSFEPSTFVLAATVPAGWRVLAPGLLMGEVPEKSGRVRYSYAVAGARELPVLAVRGMVSLQRQVGEVTVEAWHREKDAASGKKALEHAAKAVELLEARLGPLPYRTLRVVEARLQAGAGGMEFPGLVTVSSLLYQGAHSPLAALGLGDTDAAGLDALLGTVGPAVGQLFESTLELTIDHELAHQYFAMLVGSDPVQEPVADEALAQHVALLLLEWRHGARAAKELEDAQLKAAYQLHRLLGGPDAAANRPTWAFDTETEYAALVYGKAPFKFRAWRLVLGDEAWLGTLQAYVAEHRYRWVTARTLLELAQRRVPPAAQALAEAERRWWDQAHGDEDLGVLEGDLGGAADPRALEAYEKALKGLLGE